MRMEQYRIDIDRDWRCASNDVGVTYTYPAPENAKGFYPYGFVRRSDSAADVMDWYGLCLDVKGRRTLLSLRQRWRLSWATAEPQR